ncbi:MAG: O-antigen ligase family protein [Phycisphaerae bacterium]|nr:O-antigen ligase family protein [Phycisphaerae bacterium]
MDLFQTIPIVERFRQILESEHAGILMIGLFVAISVLIVLVVRGAYRPVLAMLLVGQMFSQHVGPSQGILTLMRFGAMFALVFLGFRGLSQLKGCQVLMIVYGLFMIAMSPVSSIASWSIQLGVGSTLLAVGVSSATASYVTDLDRARKVLALVALVSIAWIVANLTAGSAAKTVTWGGEGRFGGLSGGTGATANVGGFLTPFLLWGCFWCSKRIYRYACLVGLLALIPMLVYVGQRIGLFAAFVGAIPLLAFRLSAKRIVYGLVVAVIAGVLSFQLLNVINPAVRSYLMDKYIYKVKELSGREVRWVMAFRLCMRSPLVGRGAGTADMLSKQRFGGGVHNSYLTIWYDGGILAILIWVYVIIVSLLRTMRGLFSRAPPEVKDILRLLLGCLMALTSQAFFESTLASPTNLNVGLFLLCITLVDRVRSITQESAQHLAGFEYQGSLMDVRQAQQQPSW